MRCGFLEIRHCKTGWVKFVVGRAEAPQTCVWMLSVVSPWDIVLHAGIATARLRMPPHQGPPCSIRMALGVPTKLPQMPFTEELPEQGQMRAVVRWNSWRSLASAENWRPSAFASVWGTGDLCSTGTTSMCRRGSNVLNLEEMKNFIFFPMLCIRITLEILCFWFCFCSSQLFRKYLNQKNWGSAQDHWGRN